MSRTRIAPINLRALAAEMRQFFPQRPEDSADLKKLRAANKKAFERWQDKQIAPAAAV
jgi:hypothetical protein